MIRQAIAQLLDGQSLSAEDVVLLNAAAALLVGGMAADLREGVALAAESTDRGAALEKLEALVGLSQAIAN